MSTANDLAAMIESARSATWLDRAACADLDPDQLELFFVEAGRSLSPVAAELCCRCPVRSECLDHATQRSLAAGYFGGVSPIGRRSRRSSGPDPARSEPPATSSGPTSAPP